MDIISFYSGSGETEEPTDAQQPMRRFARARAQAPLPLLQFDITGRKRPGKGQGEDKRSFETHTQGVRYGVVAARHRRKITIRNENNISWRERETRTVRIYSRMCVCRGKATERPWEFTSFLGSLWTVDCFSLSPPWYLFLSLFRHGEKTIAGWPCARVRCTSGRRWAPEEWSFLSTENWFRMLSCTISKLPPCIQMPVARDSICPREESNRGPGKTNWPDGSVVESRPRGRVVRDGLGVSSRVGEAHPPLPSRSLPFPRLPAPFRTSSFDLRPVYPSLSLSLFLFILSICLSRFLLLSLCPVPYSLPFSRVLSLSLSVQLAGARGSDPESSTALPRMAPLTTSPSTLVPLPVSLSFVLCTET